MKNGDQSMYGTISLEREIARACASPGTPERRSSVAAQSMANRRATRLGIGDQLALDGGCANDSRSCSCMARFWRSSSARGLGPAQPIDDADAPRRVLHVDDRPVILRGDLHRRVLRAGRRPADQERDRRSPRAPSRLATCTISSSDGVISPDRPIMSTSRSRALLQDLLAGHHHAQVDDLVVVAGEHHADDVLADVVDVALDRGHQDLAARLVFGARCSPAAAAALAFSASMNGVR